MTSPAAKETVVAPLLSWFRKNARDLPWRRGYDPYHVLVSEFMLQQTPVARVLPVWQAWLERWPTPGALAADPSAVQTCTFHEHDWNERSGGPA